MNEKLKKFLEAVALIGEAIVAFATATKVILVAVGALALVMFVYTKKIDGVEQQYIAQMRVYEQDAEAARKHADKLAVEITVHKDAAAVAEQKATRLGQTVAAARANTNVTLQELEHIRRAITDSVELARVVIPRQDSIIGLQQQTIANQDEQVTFLQYALVKKDTALIISTHRGDSLYTVLANLPSVPVVTPRYSLKKIFGAGVVTGIIATVLLK